MCNETICSRQAYPIIFTQELSGIGNFCCPIILTLTPPASISGTFAMPEASLRLLFGQCATVV
jgi:hypothetical protein